MEIDFKNIHGYELHIKGIKWKSIMKNRKVLGAFLVMLSFILFVNIGPKVSALENVHESGESVVIEDKPVYINEEYVGRIVVTEETDTNQFGPYATYPLQNKTYDVTFYGLSANVGYKVDVRNGRITNAYGAWAWGILWNVAPTTPIYSAYESSLSGQASVGVRDFGFSTTFTLRGYIGVDNQFHTRIDAP